MQVEDGFIRTNTSTPEKGGGERLEVEPVFVQKFQPVPVIETGLV